jgi:hypothetical protein
MASHDVTNTPGTSPARARAHAHSIPSLRFHRTTLTHPHTHTHTHRVHKGLHYCVHCTYLALVVRLGAIPSHHRCLLLRDCVWLARHPPSATWGAPPTGALPGAAPSWTARPSGSTTRRTSRQSYRQPRHPRRRLRQTNGFQIGAAPRKQATRTATRSATAGTCRTGTRTQNTVLPSAPRTRCRRAARCLLGGSSVTTPSGARIPRAVRLAGWHAVRWLILITTFLARAGGTRSTATPSGGCPTATSSPGSRVRSRRSASRCQTGRRASP